MNAWFFAGDSDPWHVAGWTMVHFLWIGGLVAVGALLSRAILRRARASVRYGVMLAWFVLMAASPGAIALWVNGNLADGDVVSAHGSAVGSAPGQIAAAEPVAPGSASGFSGANNSTDIAGGTPETAPWQSQGLPRENSGAAHGVGSSPTGLAPTETIELNPLSPDYAGGIHGQEIAGVREAVEESAPWRSQGLPGQVWPTDGLAGERGGDESAPAHGSAVGSAPGQLALAEPVAPGAIGFSGATNSNVMASGTPEAAPWQSQGLSALLAAIERCVPYLPWVWIVGAPLTFLLLVTGMVGAKRLERASRVLEDGPIVEVVERLRSSLGISRRVCVAVCERIAAPVLVGIVRPLILLPPSALTGWSPDEIEMVLLHELAHVRRWDNGVNLVQRIIESVLFFHPAVWLVSGWVRREREASCDAVVVRHTERPQAYAEMLVALAAELPRSVLFHPAASSVTASAMAAGPLRSRIRRILQVEEDPMLVSGKSLIVVLGSLAVAATLTLIYLPALGAAEEAGAANADEFAVAQELTTEDTERTEEPEKDEIAVVVKEKLANELSDRAKREFVRQSESARNLKKLLLALHNYHDAYKRFPAHASYGADGQPLLSWRVHVLPFIEGGAKLYEEFHLDEPWDSPHNRRLVERMPEVFRNPEVDVELDRDAENAAERGKTGYLAVVGEHCVFDGSANGIQMARITDGTSRTIMLVEANADQAVEWTKPADFEHDAEEPAVGLGAVRPQGWLAGLADGSVRLVANDVDAEGLRRDFERDDESRASIAEPMAGDLGAYLVPAAADDPAIMGGAMGMEGEGMVGRGDAPAVPQRVVAVHEIPAELVDNVRRWAEFVNVQSKWSGQRLILQAAPAVHEELRTLLAATERWRAADAVASRRENALFAEKSGGKTQRVDWKTLGLTFGEESPAGSPWEGAASPWGNVEVGVAVVGVEPGSPAAWQAIRPGERLWSIDGLATGSLNELESVISNLLKAYEGNPIIDLQFVQRLDGMQFQSKPCQFELRPDQEDAPVAPGVEPIARDLAGAANVTIDPSARDAIDRSLTAPDAAAAPPENEPVAESPIAPQRVVAVYEIPDALTNAVREWAQFANVRATWDGNRRFILQEVPSVHEGFSSLLEATEKWRAPDAVAARIRQPIVVEQQDGEPRLAWTSAGLTFRDMDRSRWPRFSPAPKGFVEVVAVEPGSPAAWLDIRPGYALGSFSGLETANLKELESVIRSLLQGGRNRLVELAFYRVDEEGTLLSSQPRRLPLRPDEGPADGTLRWTDWTRDARQARATDTPRSAVDRGRSTDISERNQNVTEQPLADDAGSVPDLFGVPMSPGAAIVDRFEGQIAGLRERREPSEESSAGEVELKKDSDPGDAPPETTAIGDPSAKPTTDGSSADLPTADDDAAWRAALEKLSDEERAIAERAERELGIKVAPASEAELASARKQGLRGGLKLFAFDQFPQFEEPFILTHIQSRPLSRGIVELGDVEKILDAIKGLPSGSSIDLQGIAKSGGFNYSLKLPTREAGSGARTASRFPSLEEQKLADLAYKSLDLELEPIDESELGRVMVAGYAGGVRVAKPFGRAEGQFQPGDILVGLHVWPTTSMQAVAEVLSRDDLRELSPLKYYLVRRVVNYVNDGGVAREDVQDKTISGRVYVNVPARRSREARQTPAADEGEARTGAPRAEEMEFLRNEIEKASTKKFELMRQRAVWTAMLPQLDDQPEAAREFRKGIEATDKDVENLTAEVDRLLKEYKRLGAGQDPVEPSAPTIGAPTFGGVTPRIIVQSPEPVLVPTIPPGATLPAYIPRPTLTDGTATGGDPTWNGADPAWNGNSPPGPLNNPPVPMAPSAKPPSEAAPFTTAPSATMPSGPQATRLPAIPDPTAPIAANPPAIYEGPQGGGNKALPPYNPTRPFTAPAFPPLPVPVAYPPSDPRSLAPPSPDPSSGRDTKAPRENLRYDGRSFDEWSRLWRTELSNDKRAEAVKALAAFARAGYGKEAVDVILDVAGEYDFYIRNTSAI